MEDADLQAIRAKRMAELQAAKGGAPAAPLVGGAGPKRGGGEEEERRKQMEEMRRNMLVQILSPEARERLSRISIVKPEKARGVEDILLRMAQSGQVREKISEPQLIDLLEQVNQGSQKESKIVFSRRRADDDDDEDDF